MPTKPKKVAALSVGKTVLLVDDNIDNLQIFGDVLQPYYVVRAAKSGEAALLAAKKLPHPDLILLDIMMPVMDGYEVLRQLRASPGMANIPVIFLTAMNTEADEARGLALGAADYIPKPVIPELLLARVRTQLELKEARDWLMDRNSVLAAEVARQVVDLKAAKEAAEAASQRKSVFINNMSHELLNPMHGVIGMLQLLEMEMPSEGSSKHYLKSAMESAQSMVELIRKILAYKDLVRGEIALTEFPIHIREWMEEISYSWRAKFDKKQLSFVTHVSANVPEQIVCDDSQLRRILEILFDNALKFTPAGEIEVQLDAINSTLLISIRDTGIGISEDVLERLFKPFEQGEGSISRRFDGMGLSLSIAKHIALRIGGDLCCVSQVGKGSTFHLTLPIKFA